MASAEAGASLETLSAVLQPGNAIAAPALAMPQLREIAIDSFIQSFFFARRTRLDVPFEGGHARQSLSYRPRPLELVQFSAQRSQIPRTGSLPGPILERSVSRVAAFEIAST